MSNYVCMCIYHIFVKSNTMSTFEKTKVWANLKPNLQVEIWFDFHNLKKTAYAAPNLLILGLSGM